jgi:hypothetical protein
MATAKPKTKTDNAVSLLTADHRAVEDLFEKYEKATGVNAKVKLAQEICTELEIHATIEEEIFYPGVSGKVKVGTLDEAYVEHDGAKMLIAELLAGSPDDDFYDAKMHVLSEEIRHHVQEEEQKDGLFAQANAAGVDMLELGARLAARKLELKASFRKSGTPTPQTRTMKGIELKVGHPIA